MKKSIVFSLFTLCVISNGTFYANDFAACASIGAASGILSGLLLSELEKNSFTDGKTAPLIFAMGTFGLPILSGILVNAISNKVDTQETKESNTKNTLLAHTLAHCISRLNTQQSFGMLTTAAPALVTCCYKWPAPMALVTFFTMCSL